MYTANFSNYSAHSLRGLILLQYMDTLRHAGSYTYYFTLLEYTAADAYGFTFTPVRSEEVKIALSNPSLISCFAVVVS